MATDFKQLMSQKSNENLEEYIHNVRKYVPDAVEAAIIELEGRGRVFTADDIDSIKKQIEEKKLEIQKEEDGMFINWKKNIVTDVNAPMYYSERTINVFSILFSILSGAILLAINISKTKHKNIIPLLLAFAVSYVILEIWLFSSVINTNNGTSGLTLLMNGLGAFVLDKWFWKKYLGDETKYRAKPIWVPLTICIFISILGILAGIYAQ